MNRRSIKAWLLLALIFVLGMVAGGALVIGFRPETPHGPPPGTAQLRNHWMVHLAHRLNLTPDQQAKIEPILNDAANKMENVHREEVGKISQIMDDANAKIAPLLTPDQQAQLKQMHDERDRAFNGHARMHDGMHPGDGNGPGGPPMGPGAGPGGGNFPQGLPPASPSAPSH